MSYRDKLQSLNFRPRTPAPKKTVDVTDTSVNTTTEHFNDRVDVKIDVTKSANA